MTSRDETSLELFKVPCLVVHLDLQSIDLKELGAFLRLVVALVGSGGVGQISQKLLVLSIEARVLKWMQTFASLVYSFLSSHSLANFKFVFALSRYSMGDWALVDEMECQLTYLIFSLHKGIFGRLVELLEDINLDWTTLSTPNVIQDTVD